MLVFGIVAAAGAGARFGGAKQFEHLAGRRIVDRAVEAASRVCDGLVLVLPHGSGWDGAAVTTVVAGGATRTASVRAALAAVPDDAGIVVVHDAARPLAAAPLFAAVVSAVLGGADAAVPALPIVDTLKRVDGDRVTATVTREGVVAVQTPQAFRAAALRAAHATGGDATDDAALVEAAGGSVVVVPGDPANLKVTTPRDLEVARAWLDAREARRS